jgi:hypothetical protein
MQACYYFTTQGVPDLVQLLDSASSFFKRQREPLLMRQLSAKYAASDVASAYGCVGANFNPLELLALFCSAAMHDFEHPGRSNQFMIAINSPLVIISIIIVFTSRIPLYFDSIIRIGVDVQ